MVADSKVISADTASVHLSMKVSKKVWLLLGLGILAVLAVTLWVLRNQQVAEQKRLKDELELVNSRLAGLELDQLTAQLQQTKTQTDNVNAEFLQLKGIVGNPTDSIAASDTLYAIAKKCDVAIEEISASEEQTATIAGVPCNVIALQATAKGEWSKLVDFVSALKTDFVTCLVNTAAFTRSEDPEEHLSSLRAKLTIYTFKGR